MPTANSLFRDINVTYFAFPPPLLMQVFYKKFRNIGRVQNTSTAELRSKEKSEWYANEEQNVIRRGNSPAQIT